MTIDPKDMIKKEDGLAMIIDDPDVDVASIYQKWYEDRIASDAASMYRVSPRPPWSGGSSSAAGISEERMRVAQRERDEAKEENRLLREKVIKLEAEVKALHEALIELGQQQRKD